MPSMSNLGNGSPGPISRAPSPPPPEVDWTVAAHELSKLLIPIDRQTMSCKPEDLSVEATRARRDRQSIITPPASNSGSEAPEPSRMALRTRKPAKPMVETVQEDAAKKPASKANRRKTVAGAAVIAAEKVLYRSHLSWVLMLIHIGHVEEHHSNARAELLKADEPIKPTS